MTRMPFLGRVLSKWPKAWRRLRTEGPADPFRPMTEAELYAAAAVPLNTPLLQAIVHLLRAQHEQTIADLEALHGREGAQDTIRGLLGYAAACRDSVDTIRRFVAEANDRLRMVALANQEPRP